MPGSKNVTKSNKKSQKSESEISIQQKNAIDLLVQGKTDQEAAEEIGVTRETVCRWRNKDPEFVARLNSKRKQVWGSQVDRLRKLASSAVDVLKDNLENAEDPKLRMKAAVHILKSIGLYGAGHEPKGSESPREIANMWSKEGTQGFELEHNPWEHKDYI